MKDLNSSFIDNIKNYSSELKLNVIKSDILDSINEANENNLSFDRWGEIFIDPVMTAAMTDRLTHKSFIINMNGNSYRMKETKTWLEGLNVN